MRMIWTALALVVLGLALSVPGQLGAQQVSGETPAWKLGDYWTFREEWDDGRQKGSRTYTRTVTKVDETFEGQKVYWTSRGDGTFSIMSADDLELVAVVDSAGTVRSRGGTRKGDKVFPLTVGRTFSFEYEAPNGAYKGIYTYTVAWVEELRVPVGAFQTLHVTGGGTGKMKDGSPFVAKEDRFFAPAAKNFIRYAYTVGSYKYMNELTRYQVRE